MKCENISIVKLSGHSMCNDSYPCGAQTEKASCDEPNHIIFLRIQDEVFFTKMSYVKLGSSCNRSIMNTHGCDLSNYTPKWFDLERACVAVLSVTVIIISHCDCYCDFSISVIMKRD